MPPKPPALTITSNNDVISVFSRSSTAEFAGVWASGRLSGDAANTFRTPTLVKAGEAHYSPFANRWGDYSSVAIDPSDQTMAWVSGEYACPGGCANGSNWGTWIAQTSISAAVANTVTGTILITGVPQSGKTVKLKQGAVVVGTTTTNGSGAYTFTPVNAGIYKVIIKGLSGAGDYSGNISVNAVGEAGKTVKVSNGGGSTTTNASGNFTKVGVLAGNHKVTIKNVDVP